MRIPPFALLLALVLPTIARADAPLFMVDNPFDPPAITTIYTVDPDTGAMTVRGVLGNPYAPVLALAAADGHTLYAAGTDNAGTMCTGSTFACLLLKIVLDPSSTEPASVEVIGPVRNGMDPVAGVVGMTFRDNGVLYMESQDDNGLYTLDPATGQATPVGTSNVVLYGGDITFDADGHLLVWTNDFVVSAGLYELDPASAAATLVDLEAGSSFSGLAALGHSNVLYASNIYTDRLYTADPVTGFTGLSAPLTLDGVPFDHKRGDLDSPYCVDDAACDDADACTRDRCTAGGCRHLYEDATCDGIDDDCDGQADEDYLPQPTECGVGACAATGATACVNGAVEDGCTPGIPAADDTSCNGIDDDCDGQVDEDGDPDADGITSCFDNCPTVANADQANADGDHAGDACDCAPADPLNGPAVEVGGTLRLSKSTGGAALTWSNDAIAGPFTLYRGYRRPGTGWSYDHYCLGQPAAGSYAQDVLTPRPGTVFYYVVARDGCGESVLGRDSAGAPIPNDDPCPSTGQDADGDGVEEAIDNCPGVWNPTQGDTEGDGIGDACK